MNSTAEALPSGQQTHQVGHHRALARRGEASWSAGGEGLSGPGNGAPRTTRRLAALAVALTALAVVAGYVALWSEVLRHSSPTPAPLPAYASDAFMPWYGARAVMAGQNPYTIAFQGELQQLYYGADHTGDPGVENPAGFYYPAFVALSLLPVLWLPFGIARWVIAAGLGTALAGGTALWLALSAAAAGRWPRRQRWKPSLAAAGGALLFAPSISLLLLQQLSGLVFFELVLAHWAAARRRFAVAGVLLALAAIKPQLALIPMAGLLFWALWRRERWPLLGSCAVALLAQCAFAAWRVPGWMSGFLAAVGRRHATIPELWLPGMLAGGNALLGWLLAGTLLGLLAFCWWRFRPEEAGSRAVLHAAALGFAVSLVVVPDVAHYNRVLLLPALGTLAVEGMGRSPLRRATARLAGLAVGLPVVLIGVVAWLRWLGLGTPYLRPLVLLADPAQVVLPVLVLPALLALCFERQIPAFRLSRLAAACAAAALALGYLWLANRLLLQRLLHHLEVSTSPLLPSDLFVPWLGARALVSGVDPYTDAFALQLHLAFYGMVRQPTPDMPNVAAFGYPPYVVVALAPLLWLPFEVVRWLSIVALAACVAGAAILWRKLVRPGDPPSRLAVAGVAALLFFPSLDLLWLQQLTGLVIVCLAGAVWLAARRHLCWSGVLLALAMLKPQLAALPAAGLLFWACCDRRRWALLLSSAAAMAGQLALCQWLLPSWWSEFWQANARYRAFNQSMLWLPQTLGGSRAGALAISLALLALVAAAWWSARHEAATSPRLAGAAAMSFAVAVALVPDVSFYNRALLVAPVLSVQAASTPGSLARAARRFALGAVAAPVVLMGLLSWASWLRVPLDTGVAQAILDWAEDAYLLLPVLLLPALALQTVWPGRLVGDRWWKAGRSHAVARAPAAGAVLRCLLAPTGRSWAAALVLAGAWVYTGTRVWVEQGPFSWLGYDFGFYWTAVRAFFTRGPTAAYDRAALLELARPLGAFGHTGQPVSIGVPPPYPPLLYAAMAPFGAVRPDAGYLLWTLAGVLIAAMVARSLAVRMGHRSWAAVLTMLACFPAGYSLFMGQSTMLWLAALYLACDRLRCGRDFRAGLWCGVLLMKPQYALGLGIVLLYKARWRALAGMATTGAIIAASTVWLLGRAGLQRLLSSLILFSGSGGRLPVGQVPVSREIYEHMVSWRGLVTQLLPWEWGLSHGFAIAALLSGLTLALLLIIWHGPWEPQSDRFATRLLGTMIVTLLAGFHQYVYSATLLLVPAAETLASSRPPPIVPKALHVGLYLPAILFFATGNVVTAANCIIWLMLAVLIALTGDELARLLAGRPWSRGTAPNEAAPAPV